MRGIPISVFLIIFLILIGLEAVSFAGLFRSVSKSNKRLKITFSLVYWMISLFILASFYYAFSSHDKVNTSTNYRFFNFVLLLFFFNLVPKVIVSLFTIVSGLVTIVSKKISDIIFKAGLIIALGIMITMAFSSLIDKKQIRIEKLSVSIHSLPKQLDGITIAQLSDIHLGNFNGDQSVIRKTMQILEKLHPDLILFTGDMVNNFSYETKEYIDYFRKIDAPYGKFAITGNHDYGDYYEWKSPTDRAENLREIRESIKEMGFDLLLNENRRVQIKDTAIYMIGVENWGHAPFPQYANLDKATEGIPPGIFSILMSHDPAHWGAKVVSQTNIPLTLSGHTHGGQFGIKIAGIEFSPIYFIQKYWAGLYKKNNQYLYVNRGLGVIGFDGRVDMRPEITLITLRSN